MFEKMLENKGVQAMFVQLLKGAAPDLMEQVDGFTRLVRQLVENQMAIYAQNREIISLLKGQDDGHRRTDHTIGNEGAGLAEPSGGQSGETG